MMFIIFSCHTLTAPGLPKTKKPFNATMLRLQ